MIKPSLYGEKDFRPLISMHPDNSLPSVREVIQILRVGGDIFYCNDSMNRCYLCSGYMHRKLYSSSSFRHPISKANMLYPELKENLPHNFACVICRHNLYEHLKNKLQ